MTKKLSIYFLVLPVLASIQAADLASSAQSSLSAGGSSFNPQWSADGRHLIFVSQANNLVTNDSLNLSLDVFVRDLLSSNTVLVSVSAAGTGGANADANFPSVSSNAQFVAFASRASNLTAGDTNRADDIFLRDTVNGTTLLVSVNVDGNSPADPNSFSGLPLSGDPLVSADGRWVFFESRATNLTMAGAPIGAASNSVNIYARDMSSNVTVIVSADLNTGGGVTGRSRLVGVSGDARFVLFSSTGTNLLAGVTTNAIYMRDMAFGQTVWAATNYPSFASPVMDASGRYVAFIDLATDTNGQSAGYGTIRRFERQSGTLISIGANAVTNVDRGIHMSADGSVLAFDLASNGGSQAHVWREGTGTEALAGESVVALSGNGSSIAYLVSGPYGKQIEITNGVSGPVTVNTNGVWSNASHDFAAVAVSFDGARVAFHSTASDLAAGDLNGATDVFLRDVNAGATELITKAALSLPAKTPPAHSLLGPNSISADGRFIVSLRFDDLFVPRDTNGWPDVFVTDLLSNTTVAVSVNSNIYVTNTGGIGGEGTFIDNTNRYVGPIISADGTAVFAVRRPAPGRPASIVRANSSNGVFAPQGMVLAVDALDGGFGNGESYTPSVSANGETIAFSTGPENVFGINNNVVLRRNGTNYLVSVVDLPDPGESADAHLSPDERWVVFYKGFVGLYARDVQSNITCFIGPVSITSRRAVISGNSRYVAFLQSSVYPTLYDLFTHTNVLVDDHSARAISLNHSGRYVAYARFNPPEFDQIYLRDMQGTQKELVSAALTGGPGNGASSSPLISSDGRYVVFQSTASNLVAGDANGVADIFVRDTLLGVTMLASANAHGGAGNGPSTRPIIAADGRTVAFQSFASDLVAGDYNDKRDIFVLKLGSPDTDGDGMDDDWEVAYFGNLSRNGEGDLDSDGASDLSEFLAGTDPGNNGSVFRVLTVMPVGGGSRQIIWTGNPARQYRVEFKDDTSAENWSVVNGDISWNGTTASIIDTAAANAAHRYYRAMRLP